MTAGLGADIIVALACFYNLGILIAYWRELHIPARAGGHGGCGPGARDPVRQRHRRDREPSGALVIWSLVAGYWFELYGAAVTAMVAGGLYLGSWSWTARPPGSRCSVSSWLFSEALPVHFPDRAHRGVHEPGHPGGAAAGRSA